MRTYLAQHPCVDCDESDFAILEFDRVGEKAALLSHLLRAGASWRRIEQEIVAPKCVVRTAIVPSGKAVRLVEGNQLFPGM